jgi:hypothetical protein
MNDTGLGENPLWNENAADAAHASLAECRADPTLGELVATAQTGWWRFRDAQLHVLAAGAPLLHFAKAQEQVFRAHCHDVLKDVNSARMMADPARASLETLAFAVQVWNDPDARSLTRAQRAEYASGLGWFAHLCPETDPDKAVALARSLGRLAGIAALYRKHKDADDPSRQRRLAKARTTRSGHATGNNGSATSPEGSVALPIEDAQARSPEMALSERDDTVSAPVTPGGEEPAAEEVRTTDEHVADAPKAGANPTETVELPLAVRNVAELARGALYRADLSRLLVNHLWLKQGIHPVANPAASAAEQRVLGWLQVDGIFFGPVRDASICATIAAQLVIERMPRQERRGGQPWRF